MLKYAVICPFKNVYVVYKHFNLPYVIVSIGTFIGLIDKRRLYIYIYVLGLHLQDCLPPLSIWRGNALVVYVDIAVMNLNMSEYNVSHACVSSSQDMGFMRLRSALNAASVTDQSCRGFAVMKAFCSDLEPLVSVKSNSAICCPHALITMSTSASRRHVWKFNFIIDVRRGEFIDAVFVSSAPLTQSMFI